MKRSSENLKNTVFKRPSNHPLSPVRPDPHKRGKFRRAFLCEAAVTVCDDHADFGRVVAVFVFEAAADAEFAVLVFAADRAQPSGVAPFAFIVSRYRAFVVVLAFQLQ